MTATAEQNGLPTGFKRHSPLVRQHFHEVSSCEWRSRQLSLKPPPIADEELEIATY